MYMCIVMVELCSVNILFHYGVFLFFQAEDGIRYLVRSRGLGDVYKRQGDGRSRAAGRLDSV